MNANHLTELTIDMVKQALAAGASDAECTIAEGEEFSANTRMREVMLPVLLFPVIVPVLIGVVQATGLALGSPTARDMPWLNLLLAFDAIYVSLGAVTFEHALEE